MADERTEMVVIDEHSYSTLKRPGKDSPIVKEVFEINIQLANVGNMLQLFSHVGIFIRMAQQGLKLYPVIQARLTEFTISVVELNDDSGLMVSKFATIGETVLSQFEYAFWYLYHNDTNQALEELKLISTAATKMIEQASHVRDRVNKQRDKVLVFIDEVSAEQLDLLENKKGLEEEKKEFEAEVKRAESLMKEAEEEEERYYKLFQETSKQESDAYGDLMNPFLGILNVASVYFTGREAVDVSQSHDYMDSLSQRAMMYLDKVEEYVQQKHKAIETYAVNNFRSKAAERDIEINEKTYDALIGAHESLRLIAFIMNDVVFFWKSMHNYLQFLLIESPHLDSLTHYIRTMDTEKLWKAEPFKAKVVTFYSHWVALIKVCKESLKKFVETRDNMRAALTMNDEAIAAEYRKLRLDPRLIEHQQN